MGGGALFEIEIEIRNKCVKLINILFQLKIFFFSSKEMLNWIISFWDEKKIVNLVNPTCNNEMHFSNSAIFEALQLKDKAAIQLSFNNRHDYTKYFTILHQCYKYLNNFHIVY